jgi:hypothetical protein
MQILMALTLCIISLMGPVLASDIEASEPLLVEKQLVWENPEDIRIETLQSRNPREALPNPLRAVPKDVLLVNFLPNLSVNEQLSLRATCIFFRELVDAGPAFKAIMGVKLDVAARSLASDPDNSNLLDYVRGWGPILAAMNGFPMVEGTGPIETVRNRFETLWRLRYFPNIDRIVIFRGCELYGVNTQPKVLEDFASRQTGFHFRFYTSKLWGRRLAPLCVSMLVGLWAAVYSSISPSVRISEVPWVEFLVPSITWDEFIHMGQAPVYAINTFPIVCDSMTHCITPEILKNLNNYIMVRRTVDSLASYVDGVRYLAYPYLLGIGIPWVLLVMWNYKTTLTHPQGDINVMTFKSAWEFYERARGVLHKHGWKNRLWFGTKVLASAGALALVATNIVNYVDFAANHAMYFTLSYIKEVETLQKSYFGNYLGSTSYLVKDLVESKLSPKLIWDFCATYFTPEVFRNNTPTFVATHLMSPPGIGWQYRNGTLLWSYLYSHCSNTFDVLINHKIVSADTPISILYPVYAGVNSTIMQAAPIFTEAGTWFLTSMPQLIITLHLIYLLFVAVW